MDFRTGKRYRRGKDGSGVKRIRLEKISQFRKMNKTWIRTEDISALQPQPPSPIRERRCHPHSPAPLPPVTGKKRERAVGREGVNLPTHKPQHPSM